MSLDEFPKIKMVKCRICKNKTEQHNPLCAECSRRIAVCYEDLDPIEHRHGPRIMLKAISRLYHNYNKKSMTTIANILEDLANLEP